MIRRSAAALLAKARSNEPRRFGNPLAALNVLRDIGITVGQFDASAWNPDEKDETPGNRGRAEALRKATETSYFKGPDAVWVKLVIPTAPKGVGRDQFGPLDTQTSITVSR